MQLLDGTADSRWATNSTYDSTGGFSIILVAVGAPSVTARVYAEEKAIHVKNEFQLVGEATVSGADCHLHRGTLGKRPETGDLTCSKGPVVFTVGRANFRHIDFEGNEHNEKLIEERIFVPVAETVAADLPTG